MKLSEIITLLPTLDAQGVRTLESKWSINWSLISRKEMILNDVFISKFHHKLDWFDLCKYQKLSEEFIDKYADKVNWPNITKYQVLSEPFIESHLDKLELNFICTYQKLSDDFLAKFDKIDWKHVSRHKAMSLDFIKKYKDKLYFFDMKYNLNLEDYYFAANSNFLFREGSIFKTKLLKTIITSSMDIVEVGTEIDLIDCEENFWVLKIGKNNFEIDSEVAVLV